MIRRHFMAMLGFAPAATAVAKSSALPLPPEPIPMPSVGGILAAGSDVFAPNVARRGDPDEHSPIEHARNHLEALLWAKKKGIPLDRHAPIRAYTDAHVLAMRSWSATTKARITRQYETRHYEEQQLLYAHIELDRAIKMAMAPKWMRRFL